MKVLDYKKFSCSKIIYNSPIKSKGGCLLSKMNYSYNNEEIPIYIQTPKLKVAYDLINNDSRSFLELEIDKEHIHFYEFINNIDDKNIENVHSKSEIWFDKKIPMDVIDDFYTTPIKMRKINKTPTIKFKIPLLKNNKGCDLFGEDSKPITFDLIKKNIDVICILELVGIKFYKQRFECEWNVVQLRAYTNNKSIRECLIDESFLSDNEEEENVFKINDIDIKENDKLSETNLIKENNDVKNIKINLNNKEDESIEKNEEKNNESSYKNEESLVMHLTGNLNENNIKKENQEEEHQNAENKAEVNKEEVNKQEENKEEVNKEEQNQEEENQEEGNNNSNINDLNDEEIIESDYNSETESDFQSDSDIEINNEELNNEMDEDEELLCEGLEDNLSEVPLNVTFTDEKFESETIDLENENSNNSEDEKEKEKHNISDLMTQIEKFKKLAFEKDEEVNNLKNKYKTLYSELNI